jgi:hypothetical protein
VFGWWGDDPRLVGVASGQEEDFSPGAWPWEWADTERGNVIAGGAGFTKMMAGVGRIGPCGRRHQTPQSALRLTQSWRTEVEKLTSLPRTTYRINGGNSVIHAAAERTPLSLVHDGGLRTRRVDLAVPRELR